MYTIERGKDKGKYEVYMTTENRDQAWAVYRRIHLPKNSGEKKRLKYRSRVLQREISRRWF